MWSLYSGISDSEEGRKHWHTLHNERSSPITWQVRDKRHKSPNIVQLPLDKISTRGNIYKEPDQRLPRMKKKHGTGSDWSKVSFGNSNYDGRSTAVRGIWLCGGRDRKRPPSAHVSQVWPPEQCALVRIWGIWSNPKSSNLIMGTPWRVLV